MRGFICLFLSCFLLSTAGCKRDIPKPETNSDLLPIINTDSSNVVAVSRLNMNYTEPFYVKSHVNGKDVFIECIIPAVTFRDTNASNKAKMIVYVNGKIKEEVSSAAFIIKDLPPGTHRVKLKVIKLKDASYHLQKEFLVTIP